MDACLNPEGSRKIQHPHKPGSPMGSARAMQLLNRYKNSNHRSTCQDFGFRNWTTEKAVPLTPPRRKDAYAVIDSTIQVHPYSEQPKSLSKVVQETLMEQASKDASLDPLSNVHHCNQNAFRKKSVRLSNVDASSTHRCPVPGFEDPNFSESDEDVFFDQKPLHGACHLTPPLMRKNRNPVRTTAKERQARFKKATVAAAAETQEMCPMLLSNEFQECLERRQRIEGFVAVAIDILAFEDALKCDMASFNASAANEDSSVFADWDYISIDHRLSGAEKHCVDEQSSQCEAPAVNMDVLIRSGDNTAHRCQTKPRQRSRSGCSVSLQNCAEKNGFSAEQITTLGLSSEFAPHSDRCSSATRSHEIVQIDTATQKVQEQSVKDVAVRRSPFTTATEITATEIPFNQRAGSTSSSSDDDSYVLPGRAPLRYSNTLGITESMNQLLYNDRQNAHLREAQSNVSDDIGFSPAVSRKGSCESRSDHNLSSPCCVSDWDDGMESAREKMIEQQFLMQCNDYNHLDSPSTFVKESSQSTNYFNFNYQSRTAPYV